MKLIAGHSRREYLIHGLYSASLPADDTYILANHDEPAKTVLFGVQYLMKSSLSICWYVHRNGKALKQNKIYGCIWPYLHDLQICTEWLVRPYMMQLSLWVASAWLFTVDACSRSGLEWAANGGDGKRVNARFLKISTYMSEVHNNSVF